MDQRRDQPPTVIAAADLEDHRRVPSVSARLARVAALAEAQGAKSAEKKAQ